MISALISDIHGNYAALQMVLKDIEKRGIDTIYCLGDIVGYGARPKECLDKVRKICRAVVAGNHDWGAVGKTDLSRFNSRARKVVLWSAEKLDFEDKKYLSELPLIQNFNEATIVHGTPVEPEMWNYLRYRSMLPAQFAGFECKICFIGHSHVPVIWSDRGEKIIPNWNEPLFFDSDQRYIVNAGSVGQPRDGDPRACYVIYNDVDSSITFVRLNYDIDAAAKYILKANLPESLASRLYRGF